MWGHSRAAEGPVGAFLRVRYDGRPRRAARDTIVLAVLATLVSRLPFLAAPAYPDEAGYLLVAEHWRAAGPDLYGRLWVDRPPLLILFWRASQLLGGIEGGRLLALLLVVVLVVTAGLCGWLVGGRRGAQWAAIVAGALASTPAMGAQEVDGELVAIPLVLTSCLFTLLAVHRVRRPSSQVGVAALAGLTGATAGLVKQNMLDALVFAVVLTGISWSRRTATTPEAGRVLGGGLLGVAVPVTVTVLWALGRRVGVDGLFYALYGFRSDAARVLAGSSLEAPETRLVVLVALGLASGAVLLAAGCVWASRRQLRGGDPVVLGALAMLAYGVVGVALGGDFWPHYLVALVPSLVLGAGWLADGAGPAKRWRSAVVTFVAVSSVVVTAGSGFAAGTTARRTDIAVARFLGAAANGTDTAFVAYGHADVLETAGLRPVYPHLWSLPMRVMDPHLDRLDHLLASSRAPTWFVERDDLDSWHLDPHGRLRATVDDSYRLAAEVCGTRIYLHTGTSRSLPPATPTC